MCSPSGSLRTRSKRFRSQSNTWPSEDADKSALKDLETANIVTAERWPKKQAFGCKSTDLAVEATDHIEIVQSVPAVMRVLESAKIAYESWP